MTANRRIFLNIVATYGRSLYSLALGLFTARWVLQALGHSDYGLIGLVGGLTGFVTFLNSILAQSVGRFLGVSVGAAKRTGNEIAGLDECRHWFNTALSIHIFIPLALIVIGYPIGAWAVEHFLSIPADRVASCVWVWRFTCITCFIGMVNVPFNAMYTAKQEIAELTLFGLFTTTANAIFIYYMVTHPGFWLTRYSMAICIIAAVPQIAIAARALVRYPECRIVISYWGDKKRYVELLKFAVARFWSDFSSMFSTQGQAILVNKYMGPVYNASMTVGNAVAGQALTLSGALSGAFWPVVTNKAGEGDMESMKRFSFITCRLSTILVLLFAIPLSLEIHEVLHLWLVNPPPYAAEICIVILFRSVLEQMTVGYSTAIYGVGKGVMAFAWTIGWAGISTVAISWILFALGLGMWSIMIGLVASKFIVVVTRVWFGHKLLGMSIRYWMIHICIPVIIIVMLSELIGLASLFSFHESLVRVVITTATCLLVFTPLSWYCLIEKDERDKILCKLKRL